MIKYFVADPDLSGNEQKYVTEAIQSGWVSSKGPFVERLEKEFAAYIGTKYAVACSSGTTALTLAVAALNLSPGDEVIVPNFTMIASAWPVTYAGLKPVFVDCDKDTLNIDPIKLEKAITPRTRAIIVTHIYGRPADMEAITRIAYEYNLRVIEDCAEAHGATYSGKRVGSKLDMGCFSLFGNKIITAGEGGLVTTNDPHLYEQLQHLKSMAFDEHHTFLHKKIGFNFRMTNLQAAVALAQLERIDEFLGRRREIRKIYDSYVGGLTLIRPEGSVDWVYDFLTYPPAREKIIKDLAEAGIESRYFFKPMTQQPMYFDPEWKNTSAAMMGESGLYVGLHPKLTNEDAHYIGSTLKKVLNQ